MHCLGLFGETQRRGTKDRNPRLPGQSENFHDIAQRTAHRLVNEHRFGRPQSLTPLHQKLGPFFANHPRLGSQNRFELFQVRTPIHALQQHRIHVPAHLLDAAVHFDPIFLLQRFAVFLHPRPTGRYLFAPSFVCGYHLASSNVSFGRRIVQAFRERGHVRCVAADDADAQLCADGCRATNQ